MTFRRDWSIQVDKFNNAAVFLWFICAGSKILFTNLVYFQDNELTKCVTAFFFWGTGVFLILRKMMGQGFKLDFTIILCAVILIFSVLNLNLVTFVFVILVWYSVAHLIERDIYVFLYSFSLFILILFILLFVVIYGQTYYPDGRYGEVPSFGFENSNSFPQLLVIFLLISTSRVRSSLFLGCVIVLIAAIGIKTRTMYIVIALYPFVLLVLRYIKIKLIVLLPLIICMANILFVYSLNNHVIQELDHLLSYRLAYSHYLIDNLSPYQWLFGTSFKPDIPMDMSFVNLIYNYGLLALIIIMYLLTKTMSELFKLDDYRTIAFISCFLLYAVVENVLINYYLNPVLFLLFFYAVREQSQTINDY